MRVGLVSPYSHTYPGGVGAHVEALAEELLVLGHEVRLFAPHDPDDRLARLMHRGARPQRRALPDYVVPLGRTVSWSANGSVSTMALHRRAHITVSNELRAGRLDVLHVHEPHVPVVSWTMTGTARIPLVGTFHHYSTRRAAHDAAALIGARRRFDKLHVRIAVSEAARWCAERFWGGRYRVIPNGVNLGAALGSPKPERPGLRLLFVGRPEERKGLPVLLRAFEALRGAGVEATLTIAGSTREEVAPFLLEGSELERGDLEVLGRVPEAEKWRLLHEADILCAPSIAGESFGMVLTEAFASGTPVVCSEIGGYRDVVRDGVDGLLVPPGRPEELAQALHGLAGDRERRLRMSSAAREGAERFAWPSVAGEVVGAYEDAAAVPAPASVLGRAAVRTGLKPADGLPRRPVRRVPPPEPAHPEIRRRRRREVARKALFGAGALAGAGLAGLALSRIGIDSIVGALLAATPLWVLVAFALMCASMLMRAEAWHAILHAALPGAGVRRADVVRGTAIGVLMSATLPARLGEPSRAFILARRLGQVRERLPVVLGTVVSQTLLNLLALVVLAAIMLATVGLFRDNDELLLLVELAPVPLLLAVLAASGLFRRRHGARAVRSPRVERAVALARATAGRVREGLAVFRHPRAGAWATLVQLSAWAVQCVAFYTLLIALGLGEEVGIGAAAAVLLAVNVTALLPATPSNIGVFQAACVAVLAAYGITATDALAYGIILQAVEIATALVMGMPALLREGVTWKDMRLRAMHAAPVDLGLRRRGAEAAEAEA